MHINRAYLSQTASLGHRLAGSFALRRLSLGGGLLGSSSHRVNDLLDDTGLCLLDVLGSSDGLLTLSLAHFGLLVSLLHDVLERGTGDGALEFGHLAGLLLRLQLDLALLVLTSVQHRPVDLARVALEVEGRLAFAVQEDESTQIGLDDSFTVARVNLELTEYAQIGLHFCLLLSSFR